MSEKDIQSDIMTMLAKHPKVAWCYVTTTGKIQGRGGHWISIGFPGIADIIGQLRDGRMLAIEVKVPGNKPSKDQQDFIDMVNRNNGLAGWCYSVRGAIEILE